MSNTDFDPTDPGPPVSFGAARAQAQVGTSLDAEPDKAARANTISRAIGVPPAAVYENLDQYEGQYKDHLAAGIVRGNTHLQDYINSHPLAAKVSNDDYGNLDEVSNAIGLLGTPEGLGSTSDGAAGKSVMQTAIKGFQETANLGALSEEHQKLADLLASNPVFGNVFVRQASLAGATALAGTMQVATGVFGGIAAGIGEAYKQAGGNEADADRLTRDLIIFAQVGLSGQAGLHGVVHPEVHAMVSEAARAAKAAEPYIAAGKEPPVGVHPMLDEMKVEQAKQDIDNLNEALKASVKSATRERDPELFTSFIAQHTDGNIGISADAVRKLYGDKVPEAGDGPLGFIPDLAAQLERAEATGGDIKVSTAEWLGKVEPDVAKELSDHIRVRPEGVTVEEGKELAPPEVTPGAPVDTIRQAAGLQGQVAERKLELRRVDPLASMPKADRHVFDLLDPTGESKGWMSIAEEDGGRRLFVDDIHSPEGAQSLGPKAMRDVLEQIKEQFPNAERLEGIRVSGAREQAEFDSGVNKSAKDLKAGIDLTKIKPRAKAPEREKPGLMQRAKEAILGKSPKQLELDLKAIEERELFDKASAIGMTVEGYKRIAKLINERAAEDAEAAAKKALADQRMRQTTEWKANRAELRPQVRDEVLARPEVELDEMLREGRVKISAEDITPDQAALLPKEYVGIEGIHPEDLANLFGDTHPGALVDKLVALEQARKQAGMKPKAHLERIIDAETDRQMEAKYGSLDKNILEEAKDQVLSETQESLLHEEVLARAEEAGMQLSITKDELKAAIKGFFDRQLVRDVSSDTGLAEAGRAGRAAEMALLKGDYTEAFRQKQRQFNAFTMASFAKKFEKEQARFERVADRYQARELPAVDQEYTNWVRDILARVEKLDARKVPDLIELIDKSDSGIKSLAEFVDYKTRHDLREMPVAEFLTDPFFKKGYEDLSVLDAREVHDAVKTLDTNGREEMKYIRDGEAFNLKELKSKLTESLQRFAEKKYDTEGERDQLFSGLRKAIRTAIVAHLQVETVFNRLDRFDAKGPWNQFVFRPLAEAANHEAKLEKEFAGRLAKIADKANLKETIQESLFNNPFDGQPMRMTRKNLRKVLLDNGNEGNAFKMAKGYEREPAEVKAWLDRNATKEDWDWGQRVWDMLKELGERSDTMYRGLTGVAPEKIQIKGIDTPYGRYEGGYFPLIRHELYGEDVKLSKTDLEGAGYIRATTAAGYTKKRTGAVYPLSLDLDALPNTMKQIIHDTSYRPAVIQAGKIFYDNKIKAEFAKHLGAEYADMFVPWLKDVANAQNFANGSKGARLWMGVSDFIRQNAITTLVGFNPGTVMKHTPTALASSMAEVGPKSFLKAASSLLSINEETGNSNWQFAMKQSEELQRRSRNWVETMGGGMRELEGRRGEFMHFRDVVTEVSSKPVAMGDLISAVPTWMAKYTAEMEAHGVHGDAIYAADKSVRQAHGSSAITSKSQVARAKSLSWFTGFFTFFNDLFNRQVETLWKAGEAYDLAKDGQHAEAMKLSTEVAGRLFAYVIVPALIEELVTPLMSDEKESWGKKAAKGLTFTLSSSYVIVRELASAMLNGRDPSAGLWSTTAKSLTDVARDLSAKRPKPGNVIKHGTMLTGMLTGVMPAQVGRSAEFITGNEKPKGPWGWLVGLRYGTLQNHSPTFDKYMKGH